jgi:ribosomal protein S18 acetylase RimI-like enzyme
MKLTIRNLGPSDFDEYYRVRLRALQEEPVAYSSMPKFFIECPKEKHLELLRDSASDSSFFVKGCFDDEKLVGLIGMLPETRECVDHKASLWGFYVDPAYRSKKIGDRLVKAFLEDALNDAKLRGIRLMVATPCEAAIHLFRKNGFLEYGREQESIRDLDGVFYDQIYMQISCIKLQ